MCIALIGGMDRLEKHYRDEAVRVGVDLQVFTRSENNIGAKLKKADAVVIFTNKVSHRVKKEAMNAAKLNNIPVFMHHSCGVCTLRDCLQGAGNEDEHLQSPGFLCRLTQYRGDDEEARRRERLQGR